MISVLFYVAAAVAVVSTLLVVTRRRAVHALLYLINSLLAVAVMFYLLGAPFAAALEVIVYAGAIMVLFVFVVMIFSLEEPRSGEGRRRPAFWTWAWPSFLSLVLLAEFVAVLVAPAGASPKPPWITPKAVGVLLFSTYGLGVELASMLLLSAAVGAFHLGRRLPSGSGRPGEGDGR